MFTHQQVPNVWLIGFLVNKNRLSAFFQCARLEFYRNGSRSEFGRTHTLLTQSIALGLRSWVGFSGRIEDALVLAGADRGELVEPVTRTGVLLQQFAFFGLRIVVDSLGLLYAARNVLGRRVTVPPVHRTTGSGRF